MEILTFTETAEKFGVSLATISRWVKAGKLEEGPKAGKIKTVSKKSVEFLSSDQAFQIGLESLKRRPARIKVVEEENELKRRIEELEGSMEKITRELENLRKITQKFTEEHQQNIENLYNFTQNNDKKGESKVINKRKRSSKSKKNENV